jgi:outer membrane protein OmpA-like peptidoglycan-associated protein/opacity protein-like surface antigen
MFNALLINAKLKSMKRKTLLLLIACVTMTATVFAQNRVSGGISLGGNLSHIHSSSKPTNMDYEWKGGFAGGVYLNFPIGNSVSLQPNALYSMMGTRVQVSDSAGVTSKIKQNLGYLSLPVYLKINAGNSLAFLVGPQFDFLVGANVKDASDNKTKNEDDFNQFDFALTGGIQIMPNSPVSLTLRYMHGLTDIGKASPATQGFIGSSIHNHGFQGTVNFRLFGGSKKTVAITTPAPPVVVEEPAPVVVDTDRDGIPDATDKCPTVAGLAKYEGCPVPDSDNDGINDENDKCPTVAGLERYQGCPIPDTDNDGINDEEDNCPKLAGTAANHGCPEVDASTQSKVDVMVKNISWNTSSGYVISTKSNKSLDQIASMLTADPNLKATVSVHADNTMSADKIKTLSQDRANAIKTYLISKGVSETQIEATGFGNEQPIADSKTAAGRAKNTRVEVKLHY